MQLKDIATIRSGLVVARKQAKTATQYRYKMLTLRAMAADGYIKMDLLDLFDATECLSSEYLTQKNDVIVRLSSPYTAILIDDNSTGLLLSSNFVIIRADNSKLLPEYLFWLLNTQKVKAEIQKNNSGSMLGAIRPQYYSELFITDIPIEQQEQVARLNILAKKEMQLLKRLSIQKSIYYRYAMDKAQKNMRRGHKNDD